MELILQKFGGTSVQTKKSRLMCIKKVEQSLKYNNKLVVVISAIGRKEDPYSTDMLLSLISDNFKKRYPKYTDKLMSCGEIISAIIFASELRDRGINAIPIVGKDIGIITDDNFGNANILEINIEKIVSLLNDGIVPIIAGFQGITSDGDITTLGRGGSDISAVKLAEVLECNKVQFFKDVDGLMTVDPKIVVNAKSIDEISYEELFELSIFGNNIIHPKAVKIAMESNIPIVIKNTFNDFKGTVINNNSKDTDDVFKGMTYLKNCVQIKIFRDENKENQNYYKVFQEISTKNIVIDFINIFTDHKIFTVYKKDFDDIINILDNYNLKYSIIKNCSKIGIVKANLKNVSITMAKLIELLHKENIEVMQTNHSNMSIWLLVTNDDLDRSLNVIHNNFFVTN